MQGIDARSHGAKTQAYGMLHSDVAFAADARWETEIEFHRPIRHDVTLNGRLDLVQRIHRHGKHVLRKLERIKKNRLFSDDGQARVLCPPRKGPPRFRHESSSRRASEENIQVILAKS